MTGRAVELAAVNGGLDHDGGVTHGRRLVALTEAVMRGSEVDVERERRSLRDVMTADQLVDAAAVIGSFNVVDRIADATGIPLDDMLDAPSADLRRELGLARFASAANTPRTG